MDIRIGIDTGGTFTDFVIAVPGKIIIQKILSTPRNPSRVILEGIRQYLESAVKSVIIHGTTVATNALLEHKGGKIALITTRGYEDVLFIGRQTRRRLYSLKGEPRTFLLPRRLCFGLDERTSFTGKIEKKVSVHETRDIIAKIKKTGVEAVAVSLIHSYANSSNEERIRAELKKENFLATVSSEILPEYREYERTVTTAVNTYLLPVMNRYLTNLEEQLGSVDFRIMQSNEGTISSTLAKREPIRTALSGPAAGVVGAFRLARAAGFDKIISFDMGGTSTDVSLIEKTIKRTNESLIGDFPVRIPVIDIHSVGAGGGSLAFVDKGGALRVGPQSAGADPGPACYGKGRLPTVTDANLVLGRLDPGFFLGGRMRIHLERSLEVTEKLALRINKSLLDTAAGIIAVANANMEKAIRVISVERGYDPRAFSLFSFGGAGGMHAVEIADRLQISRVIVPKNAGVLSAMGLLLSDSIKDYSKSLLRTVDRVRRHEMESHLAELRARSLKDMEEDGFRKEEILMHFSLDLRYSGQSYEINVPFRISRDFSLLSSIEDFHKEHRKLYSYQHPERQVEVVTVRLKAVGPSKKIRLSRLPETPQGPDKAFLKKQAMYYQGKTCQGSVFDRSLILPGTQGSGPALIVDFESTVFVPPGYAFYVDGYLNLVIEKRRPDGKIRPV